VVKSSSSPAETPFLCATNLQNHERNYLPVRHIQKGDDAIMLMRWFENDNERDDTGAKSILLESAKALGSEKYLR
jgi:hypothetical protein